jgi:hypothetical protein
MTVTFETLTTKIAPGTKMVANGTSEEFEVIFLACYEDGNVALTVGGYSEEYSVDFVSGLNWTLFDSDGFIIPSSAFAN